MPAHLNVNAGNDVAGHGDGDWLPAEPGEQRRDQHAATAAAAAWR